MVKTIDLMLKSLQHQNFAYCISDSVKTNTKENPLEDQGKGHVLNNISSSYDTCMLESSASRHMDALKNSFSSFVPCTRPPMLMGNKTPMRV
jgi:hypothetical protein